MIRMADPTPPSEPLWDPDNIDDIRITLYRDDGTWMLGLVVTTKRLRRIMAPCEVVTQVVDRVPGFGKVPPVGFVFMSMRTRKSNDLMSVGNKMLATFESIHCHDAVPIPLTVEQAAVLRKGKIVRMAARDGGHVMYERMPAWERLRSIFLLQADTENDVVRLLHRIRKEAGPRVMVAAADDESLW